MKPSRKILGIRLRNFDSGISKEMNWVGAILDYLDEQAESQETKASEEKECCHYKNGYADGAMIEKEQNALKNSSAIILPRPKGKSIDRTFHEFQLFWEDRHADYVDDDKFLNEWNQFIKSQE